jgi:hypothetical protein
VQCAAQCSAAQCAVQCSPVRCSALQYLRLEVVGGPGLEPEGKVQSAWRERRGVRRGRRWGRSRTRRPHLLPGTLSTVSSSPAPSPLPPTAPAADKRTADSLYSCI